MKELLFTFILSLIVSSLVNGWFFPSAAYLMPVGMKDMNESSFGLKRDASDLAEINLTDQSRSNKFMTQIDETSDERNVDFPIGANN